MKRAHLLPLIGLVCASVCAAEIPAKPPPHHGPTAPSFTLNDAAGKAVNLTEVRGRFVVLEWTNPECPFVNRIYSEGTPMTLYNKYKNKGVAWLAINSSTDSTPQKNKAWSDQQKLPYPILDDHGGKVARGYDAHGTPSIIILDAQGHMVYRGPMDGKAPGDSPDAVSHADQVLSDLLGHPPVVRKQHDDPREKNLLSPSHVEPRLKEAHVALRLPHDLKSHFSLALLQLRGKLLSTAKVK